MASKLRLKDNTAIAFPVTTLIHHHMFTHVGIHFKERKVMEAAMGIKGKQFTVLACDKTHISSIFRLNNHCEKFYDLDQHCSVIVGGDPSDSKQFGEYVKKNVKLYSLKNKYNLDVNAIPHFIRHTLADSFRSGNHFKVNVLVGGFDIDNARSFLYFLDLTGAMQEVPVAGQGIGGMLSMGILGEHSKPDLTEKMAYEAIKKCVKNIHSRFTVNLPNFQVKVIDEGGIRNLPDVTVASLLDKVV